ncbi:hypothetical protein MVEG_02389 [Podila verticillata NRRL 6337]|nr:hypothetical protein MVEG_02389 [Podila verticillata NRRL 6337]
MSFVASMSLRARLVETCTPWFFAAARWSQKVALAPPKLKTLITSADCRPAKGKSFNLSRQLLETFAQHSHYLETVLLDLIGLQGLLSPLEKSAVRKVYMSAGT